MQQQEQEQLKQEPAVQAAVEALAHTGIDANSIIDEGISQAESKLGVNAAYDAVVRFVVHYLVSKAADYEAKHTPHNLIGRLLKTIVGLFSHAPALPA